MRLGSLNAVSAERHEREVDAVRLQRVEGIVLRTTPFSESSLVGSLFTRELGKIGVIARGARRPGRVAAAAFQPTNLITCSVYMGEGSGLRTVSGVELDVAHEALSQSPERFGLAAYALELILSQLPDEEPSSRVFLLLKWLLLALNGASPDEADRTMVAFEFHLQKALGYGLRVDACARCGGPAGETTWLSVARGGVLCSSCTPQDACKEPTAAGDLMLLRTMLAEPFAQWKLRPASEVTIARLAAIARDVWETHTPVPSKSRSLAFLAEVRGSAYGGQAIACTLPGAAGETPRR
ncbi:MAG: DNA repair protein RecO [Candidatus Eisenbacteria bacterium]|nr:DNA repair protein RecO [Candidatus Eisenbacteria bacterium]